MANSINYTARDFLSILQQINADAELAATPDVWKKMFAGIGDNNSNLINAVVNALLLRTAFDRTILTDVLKLNDYDLEWKSQSSVDITITIGAAYTVSGSYTILASAIKGKTQGTIATPEQLFEGRTNVVFPMGTTSTTTTVYQQSTQDTLVIGLTDGSNWQTFDITDADVVKESLVIQIGADYFTRVTSFANTTGSDKVYKIYYRSDGTSYIQLGGVDAVSGWQYGFIPTAGQNVNATYAVGGGAAGNIADGTLTQYTGGDVAVVSITNPTEAEGGAAEETIANAIAIAPLRARETGYFVNESTGISLIQSNVSGVLLASIERIALLSVNVWIIPEGGGLPSTDLKNAVRDLLIAKSPLEDIDVTVNDPLYLTTSVTMDLALLPGAVFTAISAYCKLALVAKAHELAESLLAVFNEQGISAAITFINANFSSITGVSFTVSADGAQVADILKHTVPVKFGESMVLEDFSAQCGWITGVDYIRVRTPTSDITGISGGLIRITSVTITQI